MVVHKIVNSIFSSCTYIVHEEAYRQAVIVDCGDVQPIVEYIIEHHLELSHVLLTHTHFDHIYGLNELIRLFPSIKIVTNEFGCEGLHNPKLNISYYHADCDDFIFEGAGEAIQLCSGNEVLKIGSMEISVIATSGHDCSCQSYLIGNSAIFTGDSYILGLKVVASWPKSNKKQAVQSEHAIIELVKMHNLKVFAGHKV